MTVEVRQVERFDNVRFRGPGILKITQGDTESLTVHAPAYVMESVESRVDQGTLHVGYVSPKVVSLRVHKEIISYDLQIKDLRKLSVRGPGRVVVPDLDNDTVAIDLSGSGQVILEHLTADRLEVVIGGSGSIKVTGDVETQSLSIGGSGRYQADGLVSDFGQIRVSGTGVASVVVNDDLNVAISGSGKVIYSGFPEVFKQISGSGKLTRKRRSKKENPRQGESHE